MDSTATASTLTVALAFDCSIDLDEVGGDRAREYLHSGSRLKYTSMVKVKVRLIGGRNSVRSRDSGRR